MSVGPCVIDTTVLIDSTRRRQPAETWLANAIDGEVALHVSAVSVAEYFSGIDPSQEPDAIELLGTFRIATVTMRVGRLAGRLRHDLARRGRALDLGDALIAATALDLGLPLVTSNVRDFRAIDRLDVLEPFGDGSE